MVVDFVVRVLGASSLDDIDILSTNSLLDLASALADCKLGQDPIARGDTKYVADVVDKLGVGVAPKDDKIPDHLGRLLWCRVEIMSWKQTGRSRQRR
jgi:hypothetical protein